MGQSPYQYRKAIKRAAAQVHSGYPVTAFCQFPYGSDLQIQMPGASFLTAAQRKVHWMPVVPLSRIGKDLACYHSRCQWQKRIIKGPICCTLRNQRYKKMEGDLHNIVPVVPLLSKWRDEKNFGKVNKQAMLGECGVRRDNDVIEPPEYLKGTVARAYLYMHDVYDIALTQSERILFKQWHQNYPPAAWEKTWDMQVALKQGKHNPYIYRDKKMEQ